jgi:hypothetical protein
MRTPFYKYRASYLVLALCLISFSCNLEKDINLVLPELKPQLVAECYLEPGQPYRLALTESTSFLADPQPVIVKDATVVIFYKGKPDTLQYEPIFDTVQKKAYTHTSKTIMTGEPGDVYTLQITDKKGRTLTGTTTVLAPVPIDTVEFTYNNKNKAFLVAKFMDPGETKNYYFFSVHKGDLNKRAETDYPADDALNNGKLYAFGTGYDFQKNDTVQVTLYHIDKPYYEFLNSVDNARDANGNPFAQPAGVKSTVQGGLGVFTNLVYSRQKIILE